MQLPYAPNTVPSQVGRTLAWKGLSLREGNQGGELVETIGLTSENFPALSSRTSDAVQGSFVNSDGLFAWDELVVTASSQLYYGNVLLGAISSGPHQFAVINSQLVVWPDKIVVDLNTLTTRQMDATMGTLANTVTISESENFVKLACTPNSKLGTSESPILARDYSQNLGPVTRAYTSVSWNGTSFVRTGSALYGWEENDFEDDLPGKRVVPNITAVGGYGWPLWFSSNSEETGDNEQGIYGIVTSADIWSDSGDDHYQYYLDVYDGSSTNGDFTAQFRVGDTVTITGASVAGRNVTATIRKVEASALYFDSGIMPIGEEPNALAITRKIPDLDYICEWDNRLWGVSNSGKTIHGSALGNPFNFETFEGLSTDSYAVPIASVGDFTGIAKYNDGLLSFKEDNIYRLVGSRPSEYYLYDSTVEGVEYGSFRSIEVINEVLYYKGRVGVYAYTGGQPELISYALGTERYTDGVGGNDGHNYYISMKDSSGTARLFTYDTLHGAWMKLGDVDALSFARQGADLYYITTGGVFLVGGGSVDTTAWAAHFAPYEEGTFALKNYIRLRIGFELGKGAKCFLQVATDGEAFHPVAQFTAPGIQYESILLQLPRSHRLYLRLSGTGAFTLRSIDREYVPCSEEGNF